MRILADGQLAASSGTILAAETSAGVASRVVNISLANTSGSTTEVAVLTVTKSAGTARRICRISLAPNETAYVTGFPLSQGDILAGSSTNATTVDYVVTSGSDATPFSVTSLDASGNLKTVQSAIAGNQTISGTLGVTGKTTLASGLVMSDIGTIAAAGNAQGNATAITNRVTYVTASDGTKGVVLPAAATTEGIYFVYDTVATNGLKIYPASGDDINDGSADAAIMIAGKTMAMFIALDASTWAAVYIPHNEAINGTLAVTGKTTLSSGLVLADIGTKAATGADQAGAELITNRVTYVTASDGTKGVRLPAAATTEGIYIVYDTVATSGLKIYPASGDDINDGTADVAITIEGKTMAIFVALDASTWACSYVANT